MPRPVEGRPVGQVRHVAAHIVGHLAGVEDIVGRLAVVADTVGHLGAVEDTVQVVPKHISVSTSKSHNFSQLHVQKNQRGSFLDIEYYRAHNRMVGPVVHTTCLLRDQSFRNDSLVQE